jgi:hypothetical protein
MRFFTQLPIPVSRASINHIAIKNVIVLRFITGIKKARLFLFDRASLDRKVLRLQFFTPRSYVWIQLTHTFTKAIANILHAGAIINRRLLYDYSGHFFNLMKDAFSFVT